MNFWLVKSEPTVFSWDQLVKDKKAVWDGVRNYGARNNLRQMKKNDLVFFYHSNIGMEIVGIAKVAKEAYPDPGSPTDWSAVDLQPYKKLKQAVPLSTIKKYPDLQNIGLIRQSRLSVMPISELEWHRVLELAQTAL